MWKTANDMRSSRRLDLAILLGGPLIAGAALAFAWKGDHVSWVSRDLTLIASRAGAPGRVSAVRAFVITQDGRYEDPRFETVPVTVQLKDESRVWGQTTLAPSLVGDLAGELPLPVARPKHLWLEATAVLPGAPRLAVTAPFTLNPKIRLASSPRLAHPLQHFRSFAPELRKGEPPMEPLQARITGGACAVGAPCSLLVYISEPGATVRLKAGSSVRVKKAFPKGSTDRVVRAELVVHAPEAEVTLLVDRDGIEAARQRVRLAIALGSPAMTVDSVAPTDALNLRVYVGEEAPVILDAVKEGRWERTGTVSEQRVAAGTIELPFSRMDPGIWRLQARTDPFSARMAATRCVFIRDRRQSAENALRDVAESMTSNDPAAARVLAGERLGNVQDVAAFLLAKEEIELVSLPPAIRRRPTAETAPVAANLAALVTALLAALVTAVFAAIRGAQAVAQARRVMTMAEAPQPETDRLRAYAVVFGLATILGLAMALTALLIVWRSH